MVLRDLALAELTGGRLHVAARLHARARSARCATPSARGLPVTAEVTPHHLALTDEDVAASRLRHRLQDEPAAPLGGRRRAACREGLADGTLDASPPTTRPHSAGGEGRSSSTPPPTAWSGSRPPSRSAWRWSRTGGSPSGGSSRPSPPARRARFGLPGGTPREGARPADVAVLDPAAEWTLHRRSGFTRRAGTRRGRRSGSTGRCTHAFVGGRLVHGEASEAMMRKAILALADGTTFEGTAFGAAGEATGEVVFNTSLTGYQEILTDPSYVGQMVCMTYPEQGNYGAPRPTTSRTGSTPPPSSPATTPRCPRASGPSRSSTPT